jgi:hypothetical protein
MQVDFGQGFHLHKPEPLERVLTALAPERDKRVASRAASAGARAGG